MKLTRAAKNAALGALCCAGSLFPAAAALAAPDVVLSLVDASGRGAYVLTGEFWVDASSRTAWGVLTDYDHIENFVFGIRRSRVADRGAEGIRVEQEGSSRWLLFSRRFRLNLRIRETPWTRINFSDISHKDFKLYAGSWTLEPDADKVHVIYTLEARPNFTVPGSVMRKLLARDAHRLLKEVRSEILRRSKT